MTTFQNLNWNLSELRLHSTTANDCHFFDFVLSYFAIQLDSTEFWTRDLVIS
jgi:hypothetical protein